jgi:hypothetical protein
MREEFESVYESARAWCRERGYAGQDPFDALNSLLFQATPLRRSRFARLAWTQIFKRSPLNLRTLALVADERNAKGTALFALAALSRFRATRSAEYELEARTLLDELLEARVGAWEGAAWGYNFDWQGRAFFAPRSTPTVVPTAFAVRALVEATVTLNTSERENTLSGDVWKYLTAATGACRFILRGLNRSAETEEEVCFSYTPLDRTRVFNASLLAGEALASVGALAGRDEWIEDGLRAARYVIRRQRADGSWPYGADAYQSWADNFHTAFVLTSLARILEAFEQRQNTPVVGGVANGVGGTGQATRRGDAVADEIRQSITRGYAFWRASFFLADGWPKYYHDRAHPADAHSAGAAVVALVELRDRQDGALELAARVARWAVRELFDGRGFFYYQKRRFHTVRTPYMRWSQAWMMYALARLLETMSAE